MAKRAAAKNNQPNTTDKPPVESENKPPAEPGSGKPTAPIPTISERRQKRSAAGECPRNASHPGPRVYRTKGRTRYCVCDTCGENWKKAIESDERFTEFLIDLAESLESAGRVDNGEGQEVVVLSDEDAQLLAMEARRLLDPV